MHCVEIVVLGEDITQTGAGNVGRILSGHFISFVPWEFHRGEVQSMRYLGFFSYHPCDGILMIITANSARLLP